MLKLKKQRYVTRKEWLTYPAGTKCWAEREEYGPLILTFDDGTILVMSEPNMYAKGLEDPPTSAEYHLAY